MSRAEAISFTTVDEEGWEVEYQLPATFEVCSRCRGTGSHDHPAFANGITAEEWNGPDWDDDSREGYLEGRYDVPCSVCKGQRVVPVIDRDRCTPAQLKAFDDHERSMAELRRDERCESILCGDGW